MLGHFNYFASFRINQSPVALLVFFKKIIHIIFSLFEEHFEENELFRDKSKF